ncbi:MAG: flagellar biosynthesis protein FlhB [Rickettsiales bacterium]
MSEGGEDDSQKTEEPTHKRLEDARKKGQLVNSREVNNFFILLAFTIVLVGLMPGLMKHAYTEFAPFITSPEDFIISDAGSFKLTAAFIMLKMLSLLALPFAIAIAMALAAGFLQSQFNISWEPIGFKLERISPLKGFKRIFSVRSVVEFIKSLLKITVVGAVAYVVVHPTLEYSRALPDEDVADIMRYLQSVNSRMLIGITSMVFLIAVLDYLYQRFEYMKNLRMTKQEIKDEYRQQEGDPHVKQKLRAIRRERARKRMMADVPKSDVVITNPTHYAVALQYDELAMGAPKVMAKGADKVALRIREIAEEHKIPIVRNPPLARALYDNAEVEEEIPFEHYAAVAKVIGYVYKLKGKKPRPQDGGKGPGGATPKK